jgi:hypothetical protein
MLLALILAFCLVTRHVKLSPGITRKMEILALGVLGESVQLTRFHVLLLVNFEDCLSLSWQLNSMFLHVCSPFQPGTPVVRPFEAPTPGSGWESAPGNGFGDATFNAPTPTAQPMTPIPASYQPQTPGGQPMTPGNAGMDIMSPAIGMSFSLYTVSSSVGWDVSEQSGCTYLYFFPKCFQVMRAVAAGSCQMLWSMCPEEMVPPVV